MLPSVSVLLALCPLAALTAPSAPSLELVKRTIDCLKVGETATAQWKNAAGQTCTFTGVVGSNYGANDAGNGDYSCNGRCGAGCSGIAVGNVYTQDCLSHDLCSYFSNGTSGLTDDNCGAAFRDAIDDFSFGAVRGCGQTNPSNNVSKPSTQPICT